MSNRAVSFNEVVLVSCCERRRWDEKNDLAFGLVAVGVCGGASGEVEEAALRRMAQWMALAP